MISNTSIYKTYLFKFELSLSIALLRVCLGTTYLVETENFLLKVLKKKKRLNAN